MKEQMHDGIWIRWAPGTWEKDGSWTTSIQQNTLHKDTIKKALFILHDNRCVFVSVDELRRVISEIPANSGGTIMFRVNPDRMCIEGKPAKMEVIVSRMHKRQKAREAEYIV